MKQYSLVLSILSLSLLSSLISPIHARNKPHHAKSPSPSSSSWSPAPGPSNSDCSSIITEMMDCLSYLSIGSNDTKPTKLCCDSIEGVIEYNPQCICYGLKTSKDMGIELNNTRAIDTPKACKLATAPPHCGVIIPGASTPSASTPSASTPSASTPSMSPVSPSTGTPMTSPSSPSSSKSPAISPSSSQSPATSPSSSQSPATSPPLAESPATSPSSDESPATTSPSPSSSATNNLSVLTHTLVAALVSIAYVSVIF